MFSLIIVIVSIALVAVLALATIYYGGSTTQEAQARARASTVINQGQQLLAASEIFYNTNRRWPTNMEELVSTSHLKTIPSPPGEMGAWTQPVSGQPTYTVSVPVDESLCRAVNKQARGDDGILTQAYRTLVTQCYGTNATTLTVVVTKNGATLDATVPAGDIGTGTIPTDPADAGWLVPPGTSSSPAGGATGQENPGAPPEGLKLVGPWEVAVYAPPVGPVSLGWWTSPGLPISTTVGQTEVVTVNVRYNGAMPTNFGISWLSGSGGTVPSNIAIQNNDCGNTVYPGQNCTFDLRYTPMAAQSGVSHIIITPEGSALNNQTVTAPLRNGSMGVTVRYSATAPAAPAQTTARIQVTSGAEVSPQSGNYYLYFDLQSFTGAPLSAINSPDENSSTPGAAQEQLSITAGYLMAYQNYDAYVPWLEVYDMSSYVPYASRLWGGTARLYVPSFGGSSMSMSFTPGDVIDVRVTQNPRGDNVLEMSLPNNGANVQRWCVDVELQGGTNYKWVQTGVTSGYCQ